MRVIAGRLGGRRLVAPHGRATRPTSDRVREALFSVLGDLTDVTVLDAYAGTGALGIEALSRGAARAVFVEALRKNLASLDLVACSKVIAAPIERVLAEVARHGPFQLALVDPPYAAVTSATGGRSEVEAVLTALGKGGAFAPDARVVVEHASRDRAPVVPGLVIERTRAYGDTAVTFYSCGFPADNFPSPDPKDPL